MNTTLIALAQPYTKEIRGRRTLYTSLMNKVAIIAAMHGNETYGIDLHEQFVRLHPSLASQVKLIIGNKQALSKKIRFIDADMNRQYNTTIDSHEKTEITRVDNEIINFDPDYIIDIHTTRRNSGIFFISDTPNKIRQRIYDMLDIDVCVIQEKVIKSSLIGNYPKAVSLEYSLKSINAQTTSAFVAALHSLVKNLKVTTKNNKLFYVKNLIQKEEFEKYTDLKNHDQKEEGIALMVPKDESEMDAEYYGFWCNKL